MNHLGDQVPLVGMTAVTSNADANVVEAVALAAAGDAAAFDRLVALYSADMARVAYVICGDLDDTQDAVQVAWTIAWAKLGSLREAGRARSWLVTIAANEARRLAKTRRRAAVREIAIDPADPEAVDDGATRLPARDADAVIDLRDALRHLKPDDRTLLALRYVAGFDSTELSRATGLSAPGTRARLARLLARLREELGDG